MLSGERRSATFETRGEALEWVATLKARRRSGGLPSRQAERETVATYLVRWLDGRRVAVDPGTWRVLEGNVALHLLPHLGAVRLAALTADDVRGALGALLRPPAGTGTLAPATVRKVRGVLRQAVQQAVDDGLLARNVVAAARPPRVPQRTVKRVLPPAHVVRFWEAARGHPLEALWRLASLVPSRSGELRGLEWDGLTERPDGTATLSVGRSKTTAGLRAVELDAGLVALLREHRRRQLEHRLAAGERWAGLGLIFCTSHGAALSRGNVLRAFRRLLRRAGLPVTPRLHDLRHTAVSALLKDGVPLAEVAQVAGHANPGVTARLYADVIGRQGAPTSERLARFYEEQGQPDGAE